jgi:SAM-dependent methyltransferase
MDLSEMPGAPFRRHPWEVARARFFSLVARDAGLCSAPRAVLDVGAGDGYLAGTLLGNLPAGSSALCFDAHYTDEDLRRFGASPPPGLTFSRQRPTGRFDLILLLDVVEHVPEDRAFVSAFVADNLAPGGAVLVSVPAWPALFSRHDEALKHYRRYRPAGCRALLAEVGLAIRRSGGLFHSLLVPRALGVAGERVLAGLGRRPAAPANLGAWRGGRALSAVLEGGLAADNALSRVLARLGPSAPALPGLSFWALCEART